MEVTQDKAFSNHKLVIFRVKPTQLPDAKANTLSRLQRSLKSKEVQKTNCTDIRRNLNVVVMDSSGR